MMNLNSWFTSQRILENQHWQNWAKRLSVLMQDYQHQAHQLERGSSWMAYHIYCYKACLSLIWDHSSPELIHGILHSVMNSQLSVSQLVAWYPYPNEQWKCRNCHSSQPLCNTKQWRTFEFKHRSIISTFLSLSWPIYQILSFLSSDWYIPCWQPRAGRTRSHAWGLMDNEFEAYESWDDSLDDEVQWKWRVCWWNKGKMWRVK